MNELLKIVGMVILMTPVCAYWVCRIIDFLNVFFKGNEEENK